MNEGLIKLGLLILRIIITVYCVKKAKKLNRDTTVWGIFAFILPTIAFITIQFKKPKNSQ